VTIAQTLENKAENKTQELSRIASQSTDKLNSNIYPKTYITVSSFASPRKCQTS